MLQDRVIDRDGDPVAVGVPASGQCRTDIDHAQPGFVVDCGHLRGAPIEQQQGQRIVERQHPEHHSVNKIQAEQKPQQAQVRIGGGGKEVLDHDGALVADEPPLGVDRAVPGEAGFGPGFAVHRHIRRPRSRLVAQAQAAPPHG